MSDLKVELVAIRQPDSFRIHDVFAQWSVMVEERN